MVKRKIAEYFTLQLRNGRRLWWVGRFGGDNFAALSLIVNKDPVGGKSQSEGSVRWGGGVSKGEG